MNDDYEPKSVKRPNDLVVVLDAVNPELNVAHKWNKEIKKGYLTSLRETCSFIKKAQNYERIGQEEAALETWCQVFGDDFRRLSQ